MRWDNTVRYNLGVRAQSQDPAILGDAELRRRRPQLQQWLARHQPPRPAVRVRRRLEEQVRLSRERRGVVRRRVLAASTTRTTRRRTRWSTACRSPARSRPYTKRYAKGVVRRMARRVRLRQLRRGRRARQRQGRPAHASTGAIACSWAARSTASRTRRTRSMSGRGSATPGSEAKELFRPRGGITLQAQPLKELSVAGQWFYNWQAVRMPESGSYLTIQRRDQFRRRLARSSGRTRSPPRSRRAGVPAPLARQDIEPSRPARAASATVASRRAGARSGSTARSASTIATRPTRCRSSWRRPA